MTRQIILRLGAAPQDPVTWAAIDDGVVTDISACDSLADFAAKVTPASDQSAITAILPGELVAMRTMATPPTAPRKFLDAARLLFEDELATPVDNCHVVTAKNGEKGRIFAIDRGDMECWVDAFEANKIPLRRLTVDFECIRSAGEPASIFVDKERVIAALYGRSFAAEGTPATALFQSMQNEAEDRATIVYGAPGSLADCLSGKIEYRENSSREFFARAAEVLDGEAINLLQGEYKKDAGALLSVRNFRRPLWMAAAAAIAGLVFVAADGLRHSRISDQYTAAATALHQAAFPEIGNANMRSHARQILAQGADASFLGLAAEVAQAGENIPSLSVERIRYDAQRGQLAISVRGATNDDIDAFRQQLSARGVAVNAAGGFRRSGTFWVGELAVQLR